MMRQFIIKRLVSLLLVLLGVTFLTFLVTDLAPSDGAEMYYLSRGITPSEAALEEKREEMGLNQPVIVRYFDWLKNALHGDLGMSFHDGEPVMRQLTRKLPNTLKLAFGSLALVIVISLPLGVLSALYHHRWPDYLIRFLTFGGISMPNFWLGLLLTYVFAVKLGWLNVISDNSFKGMILPMMTLVIPLASAYIRQIRTAVLEEMHQSYVIGARARGMNDKEILLEYILPHCIAPIITLLGMSIGHLLGGTAIVETIFSYQGIGSMVVDAIRVRDYPVIQGYVIWMAVIYVLVNLLADIFCYWQNPRTRRGVKQ